MNKDVVSRKSLRTVALCALALSLVPAMGAAHKKKHHKKAPPAKVAKKKVPVKVAYADPSIKPVVGTWYVNQNGQESHAQRLALRPNATFAFIGSGWKSEGKYTVKEGNLDLEWTQVDGSPVKAGSMRKEIPLNAEMSAFTIDRYNYMKHAE